MSDQFLRFPELQKMVGLSRATIARLERAGQFPRRRRIGLRSVGWLRIQVTDWIDNKIEHKGDAK